MGELLYFHAAKTNYTRKRMKSSDLIPGNTYRLPIVPSEDAMQFVVRTDDGIEYSIPRLRCQMGKPAPAQLACQVKSAGDGRTILVQDYTNLLMQYYQVGRDYPFSVKARYQGTNFYELGDELGITYLHQDAAANMVVGQMVRCRVLNHTNNSLQLKIISHTTKVEELPYWTIHDIKLRALGGRRLPAWAARYVLTSPDGKVRQMYQQRDPRWLMNALSDMLELVPKWFNAQGQTDYAQVLPRLEQMLLVTRTLLEGSDYLAKCVDQERQAFRERLSYITAQLTYVQRACGLLMEGGYRAFIDRMFSNLKLSGYLYNPDFQFHTFNAILRIHPQLIHEWMGQIFDALTAWNVKNWRMEPFRSAFVRQTEVYIRENKRQVDELASFNTKENNASISQMITALAIQMLIVDQQKDEVNVNCNRAMLYRYVSSLVPSAQDVALDKALACILGQQFKPEFNWSHLRQMSILLALASAGRSADDTKPICTFAHGPNTLEVSAEHIAIRHSVATQMRPLLPNTMPMWKNLQIMVPDHYRVRVPSIARFKDLSAFCDMWADIEKFLFAQGHTQPLRATKVAQHEPKVGDIVHFRVLRLVTPDTGRCVCACTAAGPGYEAQAVINVRNFARYYCVPSIFDFQDEKTHAHILLPAKVIGLDQNGTLQLSMTEMADKHTAAHLKVGDTTLCMISEITLTQYECISEKGYKVLVSREKANEHCRKARCVKVLVTNCTKPTAIKGKILEALPDHLCFEPAMPLRHLVQQLRLSEQEVAAKGYGNVDKGSEELTHRQVEELVAILRRLAFSSEDYIQAYNYLGFARVLALMIDDDESASICTEHQELLVLLQRFARFRIIDKATLHTHDQSSKRTQMLRALYTRLFVASCIGLPECNEQLWQMQQSATSEQDEHLVKSVLSMNLMQQSGQLDSHAKNHLMEHIGKILNVNFHQTNLRFYGAESQYVEFKTSIVFPPENHMQPDLARQRQEVAAVICGLLNADGGTLYIGVNDQGYESGLEADMEYFGIKSMDKYILKIEHLIQTCLGSTANDYISIQAEEGNRYPVAVVKVKPSLRVIRVLPHQTVYVRHTTSTRPKTGHDLEIFEKDRKIRYQQIAQAMQKEANES